MFRRPLRKSKSPRSVVARINWWKTARCAAGIDAFIAGNVVAISKVRKAGGVWKVAKKIIKAKGADRAKVVVAIFGELFGIEEVVERCS